MRVEETARVAYAFKWLFENATQIKFTAKQAGTGCMVIDCAVPSNGAQVTNSFRLVGKDGLEVTKLIEQVMWLQEVMQGDEPLAEKSCAVDHENTDRTLRVVRENVPDTAGDSQPEDGPNYSVDLGGNPGSGPY